MNKNILQSQLLRWFVPLRYMSNNSELTKAWMTYTSVTSGREHKAALYFIIRVMLEVLFFPPPLCKQNLNSRLTEKEEVC